MKKLVIIPSDSLSSLEHAGRNWQQYETIYNPGGFFDEVYCLHPLNPQGYDDVQGKVKHIKADCSEFSKLIEDIKPDVIRGVGGAFGSIYANANRVHDVPIIVSVHDVRPEWTDPSLRFADRVLCVSEAVKKAVVQSAHVPEEKLTILPKRVDTSVFFHQEDSSFREQMREKYGEGKFILHVGRKSSEKNLETVIKALKFLPEEYKAVFLGAGDCSEYETLAQGEGVASRCFLEDSVKGSILPSYYSWCDCMCVPSKSEGFGLVFIEAAACECAIVTSDIAPMNEFLEDGKNAFLVKDYLNPEALAAAILRATASEPIVERVKKEARLTARRFESDYVNQLEANIYKDVISRGVSSDVVRELEEEKQDDRKIILFGAGKNGKAALHPLRGRTAYFADNDPKLEGTKIGGVPVISYKTMLEIHQDYRVVVTPNMKNGGDEIIEALVRDGVDYRTLEWYLAVNGMRRLWDFELSPEYKKAMEMIEASENIVDLGCGSSPHPKARTAVDKYIMPVQRAWGEGKPIDVSAIEQSGCRFVQADFEDLPFGDKEFDLAYSHHVVEHLDHPEKGLWEMQRIAEKGVILCPSVFAETAFGRPYHKWEISWRNDLLIFVEKTTSNLWFGGGRRLVNEKLEPPEHLNPFGILLNESDSYTGPWGCDEASQRLGELLRKYYFGHFSVIENVFVWEGGFDFIIIYKDGKTVTYRR